MVQSNSINAILSVGFAPPARALVSSMIPGRQPAQPHSLSNEDASRLRRSLEAAVATLCPRSLADRREDLVQEALLRVTRILGRAEPGRELNATYLWRTAYCALVDELRRRRQRREVPLEDAGPPESLASPRPGPAAAGRGGEIRRALAACLKGLLEPRPWR